MLIPSENDQTIWVVAKLITNVITGEDEPEVEQQAFWEQGNAQKRAEHVIKHDGIRALVYPVRFWAPIKVYSEREVTPAEPKNYWPPGGVATVGRGQELIDYSSEPRTLRLRPLPERPEPSPSSVLQQQVPVSERLLTQIVDDVWQAWRLQQADAGNLAEAGQAGPSIETLAELYQEPEAVALLSEPAQLSLPGIE